MSTSLVGWRPLGTSSSRRSAAKRAASPRRFVPSRNSPEGISADRSGSETVVTVMVVSDGIPDVPNVKPGSPDSFKTIDLSTLEFLSRNLTVRLIDASPKVGDYWRRLIPRQRVRFWAVEREVMVGWRAQVKPDADPAGQEPLWMA